MKKTIFTTVITLVIVFALFQVFSASDKSVFRNNINTVILDPGHGLPDGGAVAPDGTVESDINLAISLYIKKNLDKAGFNCIMTRTDENSIFTEGNTIHAKKVSDIRNRVKLLNANPGAVLISIHTNTYPDKSVSGAQVFYKSSNDFSKSLAEEIQNNINLRFQSDNSRKTKEIPKNVYLFKNIKNFISCIHITIFC